MKKRTLKILGFLMAMVMLFGLTAAYPATFAEDIPLSDSQSIANDTASETVATQEPQLPTAIPTELITDSMIEQAGHVRRLPYAEGDMNTVMLSNEDGTHSMYLFSYPVKYTDGDGNVRDKSNRLTAHSRSGYAYVNEENDIQTHLPTDLTKNPVTLTYGSYAVATYIGTQALSATAQLQDEKTVLYPNAFGSDTAVRYTTDFNGYKEDVILYSAAAPTTFTFLLRPVGLVPVAEDGVVRYNDEETGETVFTTSPFYIHDSAATPNGYVDTDFTLESPAEGVYVLTVTLDAEYLATEGLTYPVYVDPSLTYSSATAVEVATVYSGKPTETMTDVASSGYVGYRDSEYGVGRLLIRLNALKDNVIFRSLSADQITSVILNVQTTNSGTASTYLGTYQFAGSENWTAANATWNGANATALGTFQSMLLTTPSAGQLSFDITKAAQTWVGYEEAAETLMEKGIILINGTITSSDYLRCLYTSSSGVGLGPSVTLTYEPVIQDGTYFIRNKEFQECMMVTGTTTASGIRTKEYATNTAYKWSITLRSNGYYRIQSVASELYLGISSNDAEGTSAVAQYSSSSGRGTNWAIIATASGNFALMANPVAVASDGAITKVLAWQSSDTLGGMIGQATYYSDSVLRDEWELIPNIYGDQTFRDLSEYLIYIDEQDRQTLITERYNNVNCMGYALHIASKAYEVLDIRDYYYVYGSEAAAAKELITYESTHLPTYTYGDSDYDSTGVNNISEYAKEAFEEWLVYRGLDAYVEYEEDFEGNGENNPLADNQYRIVFRVGFMAIDQIIETSFGTFSYFDEGEFDFHLWYQTYDGTWANKHGSSGTAPEHLPSEDTPFSTQSSGWDYSIIITDSISGDSHTFTVDNFYDGVIYSYIITIP